jgi:hypothetical protein
MLKHLPLVVLLSGLITGCDRPDVNFPQVSRDQIVAWGMMGGIEDLFSQNLEGQPVGPQDISAECPLGGQVHITGTLDQADGSAADLTFDLSGCQVQRSSLGGAVSASLTLSGQVHMIRTPAGLYGTIDYHSDGLQIKGDIESRPDEASVDHDCVYSAKLSDSEAVGSVAGELCGRPVTWIYYQATCN